MDTPPKMVLPIISSINSASANRNAYPISHYHASQQQQQSESRPPRPLRPSTETGRIHPYHSSIPDHRLPLCRPLSEATGATSRKDGMREECQLWNPSWNKQINEESEKFLEDASCLGYTEDQSLAVLYVCKFDCRMARERLPKFRNTYLPVWSAADKATFEELLSTKGKIFARFRERLPHIPIRDMVNYYYYQKQQKKMQHMTSSFVSRKSLERARQRFSPEYLADIQSTVRNVILPGDQKVPCVACYKLRKNVFRLGGEHNMCTECYSYVRLNHALPPPPAADPFAPSSASAPSTPNGLPTISQRIAAEESETLPVLVKSESLRLLREHRRAVQNLTKAKEASPTAAQHAQLMNQIRGVLTEDNVLARSISASQR